MLRSNKRDNIDESKHSYTRGISPQLISLWENSSDPWGVKDFSSRFLYVNPVHFALLNLPPKFCIEGRLDSEIPHPIAEFAFHFQEHDRKVWESQQNISSLDIYPYGRKQVIQPCICEKYPLHNDRGECIGTIFHIKKIHIFSAMQFINKELPNSLVSYPPEELFTNRELDVIFFILQSLSCKEIANKLCLSYRTIENYLQIIYHKVGVHSSTQLIEFCRIKGFDRYIPQKLLNPGSHLINSGINDFL